MNERTAIIVLFSVLVIAVQLISNIERKEEIEIYVEKPVIEDPVLVHADDVGPPAYGWPIHPEDYIALSSPFGKRSLDETGGYGDDFHNGVDMYGTWHSRIVCVADGKVVGHWPAPNGYYRGHPVLGGLLVVQHDGAVSTYAHLSKTYVHEGEIVRRGQVIGRQGKTGKTASPHLHFELRIEGELVNPLQYLDGELK